MGDNLGMSELTDTTASSTLPETGTPTLERSDLNLVWIDCEMSGLDPEKEITDCP